MLADLVLESTHIRVGESGGFNVHGISLDTISNLILGGYKDDLFAAVSSLSAATETGADVTATVTELASTVPGLVAMTIALAAHEPDQVEVVRKLPVGKQIEALLAIGKLTFTGADALKNFVSELTKGLNATRQTMDQLNLTTSTGTND